MTFTNYISLYELIEKLEGARLKYSTNVLCLAPFTSDDTYTFSSYAHLIIRENTKVSKELAEKNIRIFKSLQTCVDINPSMEEYHFQRGKYLIVIVVDSIGKKYKYKIKLFDRYYGVRTGRSSNINDGG